jgi:uncharacterized protein
MRAVANLVLLGISLLGVAACACDRISEPVSADPTPLTSGSLGRPGPKRCVKEWGQKPKREPFVAGFVAPDSPASEPPETPPASKTPLRTITVSFPDAAPAGSPPSVTVEVAVSGDARQRGLMMRRSMPENRGMIFVFEEREEHAFWMHNTCIPLDMMFIDKDGFITGIEENVPTMNDNTYSVGCPSTYVLEVNAGWSRSHGVAPGQKAKIEGL